VGYDRRSPGTEGRPRDIARQVADAIASGALEVLADETTRMVKSKLSEDVRARYAA